LRGGDKLVGDATLAGENLAGESWWKDLVGDATLAGVDLAGESWWEDPFGDTTLLRGDKLVGGVALRNLFAAGETSSPGKELLLVVRNLFVTGETSSPGKEPAGDATSS